MEFEHRLGEVVVIGAAGKMGRGIALLLAQRMARGNAATAGPRLTLIDTRDDAIDGLLQYIQTQASKMAAGAGGTADVTSIIQMTTDPQRAAQASLVFEALPEVETLKVDALRQLREACSPDTWFLSNTSSIPIGELDRQAGLDGRVVGFHFYNPPPVQKLLEVIPAPSTMPDLEAAARQLAAELGKTVVTSRDVAGFIGNGHFIRECLYALQRLEEGSLDFPKAAYSIDKASREGLLRPMGIFQVMDYAGIDICAAIMEVMDRYIPDERFVSATAARMLSAGAKGGQHGDGSQKDGFFRYDGYRITDVYDVESGSYLPLATVADDVDVGDLAKPGRSWKELRGQADVAGQVREHFDWLSANGGVGARMAMDFLQASRRIATKLFDDGIAASRDDVDIVVTNGFHHLYGPLEMEIATT